MKDYKPGLYWWVRLIDETGMSGSGRVAQVAVFEDGSAVMRWLKARNTAGVGSSVFYDNVDELVWVHGHGKSQTGKLIPALSVNDTCFIQTFEGVSGPACVVEQRESAHSHYKVQMWDKNPEEPFWSHDFEVER